MRFRLENRKKSALEHQRSILEFWNEKSLIRQVIVSIRAEFFVLEIVFHPNLPSYSFSFQFQIVILLNFNFSFSRFSISKISLLLTLRFLCDS